MSQSARILGIDRVTLYNKMRKWGLRRDGEDEAVPDGVVFIPFAFVEAAANLLTNPALDPFGKIPEFKFCAVRAEPMEIRTAAAE